MNIQIGREPPYIVGNGSNISEKPGADYLYGAYIGISTSGQRTVLAPNRGDNVGAETATHPQAQHSSVLKALGSFAGPRTVRAPAERDSASVRGL